MRLVFVLLSAFLAPPDVWGVFGDDLLPEQGRGGAPRRARRPSAVTSVKLPDGRQLPSRQALAKLQSAAAAEAAGAAARAAARAAAASHLMAASPVSMLAYLDGHDTLVLDCVGSVERRGSPRGSPSGGARGGRSTSSPRRMGASAAGRSDGALRPPSYFAGANWRAVRAEIERRGAGGGGAAAAAEEEDDAAAAAALPPLVGLLDEWNAEHLIPPWLAPTVRRLWEERARVDEPP